MDFGVIYMSDRNATHAAMGLGCMIFLLFIFIPLIAAYLFIPLYLAVLVMALMGKFKDDELKFALLLPIAPFAVASLLCLMLWWCVPAIVNFSRDCLDLVTMRDDVLFRAAIPDDKCYWYFIVVLGGCIGSIFAATSIIMPKESCKPKRIDKHKPVITEKQAPQKPETINFRQEYQEYREQQYNVQKWKERRARKNKQ